MQPSKFGVGQAVRRLEDDALVRGAGHYVADYAPPGLLHAVVVRSPHAHARFRIADLAKARAMPGVALTLVEMGRELVSVLTAVTLEHGVEILRTRLELLDADLGEAIPRAGH